MTNRDNEKDYSDLTDALQFVFNQFTKDIFVSLPGIIQSYDSASKRCRVMPAINIRKTDGTSFSPSEIVNVPVLWPGGGGFVLLSPLQKGDAVEIKFSQRGITKFKDGFMQSDPGNGMFDKEDAHVIPAYGAIEVVPATEVGVSMQTETGTNYVFVEDGNIEINATSEIKMIAPEIILEATNITMTAASEITMTSITVIVNALLKVMNGVTAIGGTVMDMGTSIIRGTNVFNGPDSDVHHHPQQPDSAGHTEQDTGDPKA